ncbi:velvet factor-domain-containing protein [Thamnidium elegans]|nr:velvet factor-domain-containing protein [Thamnidium elegans]
MQGEQIDTSNNPFNLIIRQQPVHSRMCGIGERVDRRPIDPPPVVQIKMNSSNDDRLSTLSSYLFLIAVLVPAEGAEDQEQLNILLHSKLTVGRTVSSLYILRDLDGSDSAFFVFSDISVRAEGNYRLRMCLFNIKESTVNYNLSVLTEPFTVYSAKTFPGMYRSCPLVQNFAKQGLKIRIRKESGPRPSRYSHSKRKSLRKASENTSEEDDDEEEEEEEEEEFIQHTSAFKRVGSSSRDVLAATISNKRRLSLSYLLDHNQNLPDQHIKATEGCQLAPIHHDTKPSNTPYHHSDSSTDLPSIQQHFIFVPKRQQY